MNDFWYVPVVRALVFLVGLVLVSRTVNSAIRTFVLPRGAPDAITAMVFLVTRRFFNMRARFAKDVYAQDRVLVMYGPAATLLLLPVWIGLIITGYMFMYWALEMNTWVHAFRFSGSSIFTLGYEYSERFDMTLLSFSEAGMGLLIVALLITYLPAMYSAFATREAAVAQLASRAGSPPSPVTMITRMQRIHKLDNLTAFWREWEILFSQIQESHTSLAPLLFFRSHDPRMHWATAAGTVLDSAALLTAAVDVPPDPQAQLCLRAGFLALRDIADFYRVDLPADPHFPADPISISQEEFDAVCTELEAAGVPLRADRGQAWQDFAGWRVNYDKALVGICAITQAPPALWSADRAGPYVAPPLQPLLRQRHELPPKE